MKTEATYYVRLARAVTLSLVGAWAYAIYLTSDVLPRFLSGPSWVVTALAMGGAAWYSAFAIQRMVDVIKDHWSPLGLRK